MGTSREKVFAKAVELIKSAPDGIRYSNLIRRLHEELPEIPVNTIHGSIWELMQQTKEVYRPVQGLYRHTKFKDTQIESTEVGSATKLKQQEKQKEEKFYEPFADWLVNELEDCTKAISLGGNKFKEKWGTPDVVGVRVPRRGDIIQIPIEIVSAEIKLDSKDLITAFGQACSYKLFSHKSYIVVPKDSPEEDRARIDALCLIFGIGLILFDKSNSKEPRFEIRVRPSKHEPDMFYVNKYMKQIEDMLFP